LEEMMSDFFKGQLDYLFFFSGSAFLLLISISLFGRGKMNPKWTGPGKEAKWTSLLCGELSILSLPGNSTVIEVTAPLSGRTA
jgi:hypothetical protein